MSLIDELEPEKLEEIDPPELLKDRQRVTNEEMAKALGRKPSTVKQDRKTVNKHKWADIYYGYTPVAKSNEWKRNE